MRETTVLDALKNLTADLAKESCSPAHIQKPCHKRGDSEIVILEPAYSINKLLWRENEPLLVAIRTYLLDTLHCIARLAYASGSVYDNKAEIILCAICE
jgi:hypothetical protein